MEETFDLLQIDVRMKTACSSVFILSSFHLTLATLSLASPPSCRSNQPKIAGVFFDACCIMALVRHRDQSPVY